MYFITFTNIQSRLSDFQKAYDYYNLLSARQATSLFFQIFHQSELINLNILDIE